MMHAMLIGWLPFNHQNRAELERQICNEELDYKHLKRIKNASIKNEMRRELNGKLRKISDDCIDLLERMLKKEPETRINIIEIYEHPWIEKYKFRGYDSEVDSSEDSCEIEDSFNENLKKEEDSLFVKKTNQIPSHLMFEITENDNETTGNYVKVNLSNTKNP